MNLIDELGGYARAKSVVDNCPKNGMFYRDMDSVCDPLEILYYVWYGTSLLVLDENNGWVKSIYHTGSEYIADQLRDIDKLKSELLEYRREHGIYEVGDLVVSINKDTRTDVLMEVLELRSLSLIRLKIISSSICGYDYSHELRHATDEEIKAGHRLP